jgi:hypothetical protein
MNAHFRQSLPNRRFRRLLPAALATAALAAGSLAGPARAATDHRHHAPPRAKPQLVVTAPATAVTRTPRVQPTAQS